MDKQPCVYMLAKASHSTLYTGVTSDLPARATSIAKVSFEVSPNATG
jgi:predicted GIY-YIG superfamily endonuclease